MSGHAGTPIAATLARDAPIATPRAPGGDAPIRGPAAPGALSARDRRDQIARLVAEHERVSVADLAESFLVTDTSIRRDLVILEEFGKALVVEPYLSTVVIGGGFLKAAKPAGANELMGKIIAAAAAPMRTFSSRCSRPLPA